MVASTRLRMTATAESPSMVTVAETAQPEWAYRALERTRERCPVAPAVLCDMLHKWHREVFFNGRSSVS
jgi:hypothetical protein